MRLVGHVTHMGESRSVQRILVRKPEGKRPLGRSRHRRIILSCIFRKWNERAWAGLIWFKVDTRG